MKLLIVSTMLLLLNAIPLLKVDGQETVQKSDSYTPGLQKRFIGRWMRSLYPTTSNPTNSYTNYGEHITNARSENQRLVSLGPLENDFKVKNAKGDLIQMRFPSDIQLQILEHLSLSFEDAVEIALEKGASIDWAFNWAYRYHDPSKDGYSIIQEWMKMGESPAKDGWKDNMLLNPTLKKLFAWKGGLIPTRINLRSAAEEGNLDIVKYLIAVGMKPYLRDLFAAIKHGNLDIVKYLIERGELP